MCVALPFDPPFAVSPVPGVFVCEPEPFVFASPPLAPVPVPFPPDADVAPLSLLAVALPACP